MSDETWWKEGRGEERRFEVSVLIGPCTQDEAESFLTNLSWRVGQELGAAFSMAALDEAAA